MPFYQLLQDLNKTIIFKTVLFHHIFFTGKSFIWSASLSVRITLQGFPAARLCGGMSLVTTLPAPITEPSLMVTPPPTTTLDASQQLSSITIGFAYSRL